MSDISSNQYETNNLKKHYISVNKKFWLSHTFALSWMIFSIIISIPWLNDLGNLITKPVAFFIIAGIGYIPGYINFFNIASLLLDKQPLFKTINPKDSVTIIIACKDEEKNIRTTLFHIKNQDYEGKIDIIIVDNNSRDNTSKVAQISGHDLNLNLKILYEKKEGKFNALNKALNFINTKYLITLDADTLLHKSAVRYIISRINSAPDNVCAVASTVLVQNSRQNLITKIQEWDYFLGIASIKRIQGLYQGTLVAQGAFSLYKTNSIKSIGGWPNAIGEDIVLTWSLLNNNMKVYFEPLAIGFTKVPSTLKHLSRQRSRWARGMIEALKIIKPWNHPIKYVRYLTGINFVMPYLDIVYTFCWIPGLIFAFFGKYWLVGPITLLVIPLALIQNYILYKYQKNTFKKLNLKIRRNKFGYIIYVLFYQILMSPISILGYFEEIFALTRKWK